MPTPTPHDALFKAAFSQPDLARGELELVLPAAVREQLDLATLDVCPGSFVDEDSRQLHTDLLYRVATRGGTSALVYVLFEHQSTFDAGMPLRLLKYIVRIWDKWAQDNEASKLPPVIPVVLHHGESRWRAAPELASMLDATPEMLAAVAPFQPLFRFVVDDLAALTVESLAARRLHALALLVELALWASRPIERLELAHPHLRAVRADILLDDRARALLSLVLNYLFGQAADEVKGERVRSILLDIAGPEGREEVMNLGEKLIQQGLERGLEQGLERGLEQGLERGAQGLRTGVLAMITSRGLPLSDVGRARIAACTDIDRLNQWLLRAITASAEDDVFG